MSNEETSSSSSNNGPSTGTKSTKTNQTIQNRSKTRKKSISNNSVSASSSSSKNLTSNTKSSACSTSTSSGASSSKATSSAKSIITSHTSPQIESEKVNSNKKITKKQSDEQIESDTNENDSPIQELSKKSCPWSLTEPLEACDLQGNWYPAKIVEIKDSKVKIHFMRWKKRYDQWFDMNTDLIRSKRISDDSKEPVFSLNEQILARWIDNQWYPAKITSLGKSNCSVLFEDGVTKKMKLNSIQKMPKNYHLSKSELNAPTCNKNKGPPIATCSKTDKPPLPSASIISENVVEHKPTTIDPIEPYMKAQTFNCDICKKGFRKESLLLQHKKHFHKAVDIDVPSLVPPQLRISSNKRNKDEFNSDNVTKLKSVKSEVDSNSESEVLDSNDRKRKADTPEIPSENRKLKSEEVPQESIKKEARSSTPEVSKKIHNSNSHSKSLTVVIPRKMKPNNVLLFEDPKFEANEHENDEIEEFVKCTCPLTEESGLMVQCELCYAWQHGSCLGYKSVEDVPKHGYFCPFCIQSCKGVRSQAHSYQLNYWLKNAQHPTFTADMFESSDNSESLVVSKRAKNKKDGYVVDSFILDQKERSQNFMNQQSDNENSTTDWNDDGSSRKSFIFHDLATTHSFNQTDDVMLESDTQRKIKSDHCFNEGMTTSCETETEIVDQVEMNDDFPINNDEIDEELAQMRATNQLSAALFDCMVNLHSLNYSIYNQSEIPYQQIAERQKTLSENLDIIQSKIDKIEKVIEHKESFTSQTSTSTLSATSPENFGIQSDIPLMLPTISSSSIAPQNESINKNPLFVGSSLEHSPMITETSNNNNPKQTFSSLMLDSSNIEQDKTVEGNSLSNDQMNDSLSESQAANNSRRAPLARLLFTGNDRSISEQEENHHALTNRLSMTHDYLPINLTDGEVKLELAYHYRDLKLAKEIVLLNGR